MKARYLRMPLLETLAHLSGGEANKAVNHTDTYEPICERFGVSMEDYGQDPSGKLKMANWILGAFKYLKTKGYAQQMGRGQWALTEEGLEKFGRKQDSPAATPVPDPVPVSTTPDPDPKEYHSDPYIVSLACRQTKCFGYHSQQSNTCQRCRLATLCQDRYWKKVASFVEETVGQARPGGRPGQVVGQARW